MSMHRSLKRDVWKEKRNVRKRYERLEKLVKSLKWAEGMSVYGLPKEKVRRIKIKIKEEKEKLGIEDNLALAMETDGKQQKKQSKDIGKIK